MSSATATGPILGSQQYELVMGVAVGAALTQPEVSALQGIDPADPHVRRIAAAMLQAHGVAVDALRQADGSIVTPDYTMSPDTPTHQERLGLDEAGLTWEGRARAVYAVAAAHEQPGSPRSDIDSPESTGLTLEAGC